MAQRRVTGKGSGGRRPTFTDCQMRHALRLTEVGEPVTQVARELGMSLASSAGASKSCPRRRYEPECAGASHGA